MRLKLLAILLLMLVHVSLQRKKAYQAVVDF